MNEFEIIQLIAFFLISVICAYIAYTEYQNHLDSIKRIDENGELDNYGRHVSKTLATPSALFFITLASAISFGLLTIFVFLK